MHFSDPSSPRDSRMNVTGQGARVQAEKGWTTRMKHDTTASPQQSDDPNSVRSDAGTTLRGLEYLQADLCRSLGGLSTRPSALPAVLLRGAGSQDARLWQPREDGSRTRCLRRMFRDLSRPVCAVPISRLSALETCFQPLVQAS